MCKTLKILVLPLLLLVSTTIAAEITPAQIAELSYDRYVGDDMQMRSTMELISEKGRTRTREFISMRKDADKTRKQLIRFTSPADINGTAFLTIEEDNSNKTEQHLYLPALKRTRRIVASQKGRSFVNSDFTYEDMQRHSVDAWDYQLEGEENLLGYGCYVLVSTPKADTETQYSKTVLWIEKNSFIPLQTFFWDKKGKQSKKYSVVTFTTIDQIPTEMEVVMEDLSSGHKTRLKTLEVKYNSGLKDALFTTRRLEK